MTIPLIETSQPLADPAVRAVRDALRAGGLTAAGQDARLDVKAEVARILADVASRGDEALVDWERKLDGAELTPQALRVEPGRIAEAHAAAEPAFLELVRRAADNIRAYQQAILHRAPPPLRRGGRELSVRYTPVDRVGVYVPGGRALYPSTVLMTVVPAQVAGVRQIALASPPRHDGDLHPLVLALAGELGIAEVYRLGGAVAVAAFAYGSETVAAVDKIVGPGNAFVAEAKRLVLGRVGIDSIAGPSEVLVIADETADPEWVAADLLAQAEHDPGSAVLVTPSRELAEAVAAAIERRLGRLGRAEAVRKSLAQYSAILVVPDLRAACAVANDFAPEHLHLVTADDDEMLAQIRHAGAVFLGPHTPVPLGDYYAGPSHVLPTGGTARFFGPLSCNDFLKATSVLRYDAASLAADAADTIDFALREGLTAHADALRARRRPRRSREEGTGSRE
jgi:histidinol dehydrogenase